MTDASIHPDRPVAEISEAPQARPESTGGGSGAPTVADRLNPVTSVIIGLIAVTFIWAFYRWFITQTQHSTEQLQDWGHAFAIPLFSLYLLWRDRAKLARTPVAVFWPGVLPFLLGLMMYFYMLVAVRNHMLQGASIILALFGIVLFLAGPAVMRIAFIPIAFLAFAITISERIMIAVTFKLQEIAADGSFVLLSIIGAIGDFTVDIAGNTLTIITASGTELPLNVAEACSGMRMVIAFLALSAAVALISVRFWWQRAALILLGVPVSILMNMVRVAVLGLLMLVDPDLAAGDAHMLIGTILLIPSLALFLGVVWVLNRIVTDPEVEAAKQQTKQNIARVRKRSEHRGRGGRSTEPEGTGKPGPGTVRRRSTPRAPDPNGPDTSPEGPSESQP